MHNFERHRLSEIFGDCSEAEFLELRDSIEDQGVLEAIVVYEDKILDGWQRYRAARALGMEVPRTEFTGDTRAAGEFVLAKHARRNVTREARALAVAQVHLHCAAGPGRPRNSATVAEFSSVERMAAVAGVSTRTLHRALTVTRKAIPEVRAAIQRGELEIAPAARIALLQPSEQADALVGAKKQPGSPRHRKTRGRRTAAPTDRGAHQQEVEKLRAHISELNEKHSILIEENDRLSERLAVAAMEASKEEKVQAAALIAELRKQVKNQEHEITSLKVSRDSYMTESSELRKQCATYRTQLAKLSRTGA